MIDSKETLKKLHEAFPNMTIDDLFKALDCYTEQYQPTFTSSHIYKPNQILGEPWNGDSMKVSYNLT